MEKETLQFKDLPDYLKGMIRKIGVKAFELQQNIREDHTQREELIKEEVVVLPEDPLQAKPNQESEWMPSFGKGGNCDIFEDEMSDDESFRSHQRGFEKNIDKLLRFQLKQSQHHDEVGKVNMEKADSEKIKNKFDRRVYLLDTYKTIL